MHVTCCIITAAVDAYVFISNVYRRAEYGSLHDSPPTLRRHTVCFDCGYVSAFSLRNVNELNLAGGFLLIRHSVAHKHWTTNAEIALDYFHCVAPPFISVIRFRRTPQVRANHAFAHTHTHTNHAALAAQTIFKSVNCILQWIWISCSRLCNVRLFYFMLGSDKQILAKNFYWNSILLKFVAIKRALRRGKKRKK